MAYGGAPRKERKRCRSEASSFFAFRPCSSSSFCFFSSSSPLSPSLNTFFVAILSLLRHFLFSRRKNFFSRGKNFRVIDHAHAAAVIQPISREFFHRQKTTPERRKARSKVIRTCSACSLSLSFVFEILVLFFLSGKEGQWKFASSPDQTITPGCKDPRRPGLSQPSLSSEE